MAAMRKMDADLMSPSCCEAAFDLRRVDFEHTLDAIPGYRGFALPFSEHRHLFAVCAAAADIAGDFASMRCRHTPNEGGVSAFNPACGKIARQRLVRRLGLCDNHQAAGVLV